MSCRTAESRIKELLPDSVSLEDVAARLREAGIWKDVTADKLKRAARRGTGPRILGVQAGVYAIPVHELEIWIAEKTIDAGAEAARDRAMRSQIRQPRSMRVAKPTSRPRLVGGN